VRKEYLTLNRVQGPLIVLSNVKDVAYDEIVDIIVDGKDKKIRQ
jgi:V/A-type H+-transporting ATPase subunit B